MNETNNFAEQNQQTGYVEPENSTSTVAHTPAPVEKMVPQSKVDEIVRHSNANVAQKARQEAIAEYQKNNQQNAQQSATPTTMFGGMTLPDKAIQDLVSKQVEQQLQQVRDQYAQEQQLEQGNRLANEFNAKLDAAKSNYDDFDSVVGGFPFGTYPHAVIATNYFDNAGDIAYHLASSPLKMEGIESLARRDLENQQRGVQSNLAYTEIKKMSDAIKLNQSASTMKTANAPLSHVQPSPVGTDSGSKTVSDFRNYFAKRNL